MMGVSVGYLTTKLCIMQTYFLTDPLNSVLLLGHFAYASNSVSS
jgi:hypothetical protein